MLMQTVAFLASCSHILGLCTYFRAVKCGINFFLGSERGYRNSQIFV